MAHGSWLLRVATQRVGISERSYVSAWLVVHGSCEFLFQPFPPGWLEYPSALVLVHGSWLMALASFCFNHSRPEGWNFYALLAHAWLLLLGSCEFLFQPFPPRKLEYPSALLFVHGSWFMALASSRPEGWNIRALLCECMAHGSWLFCVSVSTTPAQRVGISERSFVSAWLMAHGSCEFLFHPSLPILFVHGSWLLAHGSWLLRVALRLLKMAIRVYLAPFSFWLLLSCFLTEFGAPVRRFHGSRPALRRRVGSFFLLKFPTGQLQPPSLLLLFLFLSFFLSLSLLSFSSSFPSLLVFLGTGPIILCVHAFVHVAFVHYYESEIHGRLIGYTPCSISLESLRK